jgi:hypothetical protein
MDFSSSLRPGEKVIWSAAIEKQQRDAAIKPAPVIAESKPRMCRELHVRDECRNIGEFHVNNQHVIRALRQKWGLKF